MVLSLLARAELQRILPNQQQMIATVGALLLSGLAYLGPAAWVWPIQNILCACLAISVARAIQIPRFAPIVLALSALVVYDVASVGLQLINLGSATLATAPQGDVTTTSAAASSSVMGAVALSKTEGIWQPGLFQVRLKGIVTDLLGLGDAVFPTLLSTFLLRFDQQMHTNYFVAYIAGFGIGCAACEFVPGIQDTGLSALLFLVPAMFATVFGLAFIQGDVSALWSFDPANEASEEELS